MLFAASRYTAMAVVLPVTMLLGASCSGSGPSQPGVEICTGEGCCRSSHDCMGWEACDAGGFCAHRDCASDRVCLRGDVCNPNRSCAPPAVFDPEAIIVWGYLNVGLGGRGIAPLEEPTRVYVGVPDHAVGELLSIPYKPALTSSGEVVYVVLEVAPLDRLTLRRFVQDAWRRDELGYWNVPLHDLDNDPIIPTPACPPYGEYVIRSGPSKVRGSAEGRGEFLHNCAAGATDWYDTEGNLVASGYRVFAWSEYGHMVIYSTVEGWFVRDAYGNDSAVFVVPFRVEGVLQVRSHGMGFWLLVQHQYTEYTVLWERWSLSTSGAMVNEGAFPIPVETIDKRGRGYGFAYKVDPKTGGLRYGVFRCLPATDSCELVYDESVDLLAGAPDNWLPRSQIHFNYPMSRLITGP